MDILITLIGIAAIIMIFSYIHDEYEKNQIPYDMWKEENAEYKLVQSYPPPH